MFNKILIPLDGSEYSRRAPRVTLRLAAAGDATLSALGLFGDDVRPNL